MVMHLMLSMLLMYSCTPDSSIAPLLDMRRRFKAVMEVLGAVIRHGASLSRSVELTARWDGIPNATPLYPFTFGDVHAVEVSGLGDFHRVVSDVHRCLSDFIHGVVVHRRDEAIREWRNWLREDPLVHPYRWLRPDLVPLLHFFSVRLIFLLVVLECLLVRPRLMRNSERPGFLTFAALGKRVPA